MAGITRRQFIKLGAFGTGAVAVGSGLTTRWWGLEAHEIADPRTDGDRPLFLASGVSGRAALMMLALSHSRHRMLLRWDMTAIGLESVLLGLYLLGLASSAGQIGQDAPALFLGGRFTAAFWALVVVAGLGVPLLLDGLERWRRLRPTPVSPALVLVGGLALRWILVLAGQS
jgi:protein NrfD